MVYLLEEGFMQNKTKSALSIFE